MVLWKAQTTHKKWVSGTLESSDNSQQMGVCRLFGQQAPMAFCKWKFSFDLRAPPLLLFWFQPLF